MTMRMITALSLLLGFAIALPSYAQLDVGIDMTGTTSGMGAGASVNVTGGIRSSADVVTGDDLNAYEEIILESDARLTDADSSNSRVAVSYRHDGRLFGLFPVQLDSRTTVTIDEEQNVTIATKMPWWSFLVAGTGKVGAQVRQELMASPQFMADAILSEDAKARARAIEAMATAHARAEAGN